MTGGRTPRRGRWRKQVTPAVAVLLLLLVVAGAISRVVLGSTTTVVRGKLAPPHVLTGPAPWPANTTGLRTRLQLLGLPALAREGTTMHIHVHLDVYVDGRRVDVPAGIGIAEDEGFISPIHTHDASGIVHVESPERRTFTLGQLFGVWGVRFTRRCLGGYCEQGSRRMWAFVEGRRVAADPRLVVLTDREEIVLAYGTRAQLPHPIPSRYDFPPGL